MTTPVRPTETEYLALCNAIEREPTYAGLVSFIRNPSLLRDHCRSLADDGICEYPDVDAILNDPEAYRNLVEPYDGYTEE